MAASTRKAHKVTKGKKSSTRPAGGRRHHRGKTHRKGRRHHRRH